MIRKAAADDLSAVLKLYTFLGNNPVPEIDYKLLNLWKDIILEPNRHLIVAEEDGKIVSTCVLFVLPNLTHNQRPYALIENVVTDENFRKRGLATACLNYAREIAIKAGCYKIMLLTGSKLESTHRFYEKAGYNSKDKTAFIQWL
jgi:GNAT superfamily N-acetyltransferase